MRRIDSAFSIKNVGKMGRTYTTYRVVRWPPRCEYEY
jgi:hypothetical protein